MERYRGKRNPNLYLDEALTALLLAWLQLHPAQKDADAPVILTPRAARRGAAQPLSSVCLYGSLNRLSRHAGFDHAMSVRIFRYLQHDKRVIEGVGDRRLGIQFGRPGARHAAPNYVALAGWAVRGLGRARKGLEAPGPTDCDSCTAAFAPGTSACQTPGCPRNTSAEPRVNGPDALVDFHARVQRRIKAAGVTV